MVITADEIRRRGGGGISVGDYYGRAADCGCTAVDERLERIDERLSTSDSDPSPDSLGRFASIVSKRFTLCASAWFLDLSLRPKVLLVDLDGGCRSLVVLTTNQNTQLTKHRQRTEAGPID